MDSSMWGESGAGQTAEVDDVGSVGAVRGRALEDPSDVHVWRIDDLGDDGDAVLAQVGTCGRRFRRTREDP